MPIKVTNDDPPIDAVLGCGDRSYFADDVRGSCSGCAAPIVYRPHLARIARKLCLACLAKETRGQQVAVSITKTTLGEVILHSSKARWQG